MSDLRKWRVAVSDALGSYTLSEPSVPKVFDPVEELSTQVFEGHMCLALTTRVLSTRGDTRTHCTYNASCAWTNSGRGGCRAWLSISPRPITPWLELRGTCRICPQTGVLRTKLMDQIQSHNPGPVQIQSPKSSLQSSWTKSMDQVHGPNPIQIRGPNPVS